MSERHRQSIRYWTEFCDHLRQRGGLQFRDPSLIAKERHFIEFPMRTHVLRASQRVKPAVIAAAFIIKGRDATTYFEALKQQKAEIHNECGGSLSWYAGAASEKRIAFLKRGIDVTDETDWHNQHEWIAIKLEKINEVFRPRIESLKS